MLKLRENEAMYQFTHHGAYMKIIKVFLIFFA